jgi:hypothetical protein
MHSHLRKFSNVCHAFPPEFFSLYCQLISLTQMNEEEKPSKDKVPEQFIFTGHGISPSSQLQLSQ